MCGSVEVRINGLAGELCTIDADATWTWQHVKGAVETAAGIPAREQRLFAGTSEVRDDDRVCARVTSGDAFASLALVRRDPLQAQWIENVEESWTRLRRAPDCVRADREVVMAAMAENERALFFAADELRRDPEFVRAAVARNPQALECASPALRNDRAFIFDVVGHHWSALQYAPETFRADRDVVLAAVAQKGWTLQLAAEELKADREVVLAAAAQSANALQFACKELWSDPEFVQAAVGLHGERVLGLTSPELREDREGMVAAAMVTAFG